MQHINHTKMALNCHKVTTRSQSRTRQEELKLSKERRIADLQRTIHQGEGEMRSTEADIQQLESKLNTLAEKIKGLHSSLSESKKANMTVAPSPQTNTAIDGPGQSPDLVHQSPVEWREEVPSASIHGAFSNQHQLPDLTHSYFNTCGPCPGFLGPFYPQLYQPSVVDCTCQMYCISYC